jgi:hypothetical protein
LGVPIAQSPTAKAAGETIGTDFIQIIGITETGIAAGH